MIFQNNPKIDDSFFEPSFTVDTIPRTIKEFLESVSFFIINIDGSLVASNYYDYGITRNAIFEESEEIIVPISKILGYESFHMTKGTTLLSNFKTFFDLDSHESYNTRSNSMLDIPLEDIAETLRQSLPRDPIKTIGVNDNYFIDSNGLHRFTILKLAYLLESHYGKSKEELDKKYTIPVMCRRLDELKTFCKTILEYTDPELYISSELSYEPYLRVTGNAKVESKGKTEILNDEELLTYTLNRINEIRYLKDYNNLINTIAYQFGLSDPGNEKVKNTTFYKIIEKYAPDMLLDLNNNHNKGGGPWFK